MKRSVFAQCLACALILGVDVVAASAEEGRRGVVGGGNSGPVLAQANNTKKSAPTPEKKAGAPEQQLQIPPPEVMLLMIRTNIIAVDQANKTNNYTVLRALSAPNLQAMTPEKLSESFADMRNKRIDLAPTVVVSPQLSQPASISPQGVLQLVGFFPTQPLQVQFQINMQAVSGFWQLAGMTINAVPAGRVPGALAPADAKGGKAEKGKEEGKAPKK